MKSNICFLLTSALLTLFSIHTYACGPFHYYPYGYKMYRVFDKNAVVKPDERKENCTLWQKLTSDKIPLADIEKVVYKYTIAQMNEMMSVQDPNAFATWIRKNADWEVYDFLMLAKRCELSRGMLNDPWYYPSKNDGTYMSLKEIVEGAQAYEGTRLKDRYALQAVRAMFSARQYNECIDYWITIEDNLPDGLIKDMTRSYIIGAMARIGQTDRALDYFTDAEDLWSIIYCLQRKGEVTDAVSELEYAARYVPESWQVPELLQEIVTSFEPWGSMETPYKHRMDTTMVGDYYREKFDRLYALTVEMTKRKSSCNNAAWCYTAAFLADLDAKPYEAWKYIQQAENSPASDYLKESIRIMKMYLDAKVSVYDAAYETRLYNDLKWLAAKVRDNITDKVREAAADIYSYRSSSYNISIYYWNDMLRRILLAEVCPRMLDRRMPIRALQLANMADNLLFNVIGSVDGQTLAEYRNSPAYNSIDYRSDFFNMMLGSVSISELVSYVKRINAGKAPIDKFLDNHGFIDYDYFHDVIGTRYLKEMNYSKAVQYLSKVSSSYQDRLNTEYYMFRDPFSIDQASLKSHDDYKLTFASEMLRLEKSIDSATDKSKKAFDMIRYGTGMRNSFTYCWSLTDYRREVWPSDMYDELKPVFARVEKIYSDALHIIDNDELAAAALVRLCQWKTASEKYPETFAAKYTRISCDNLCDYSLSWVVQTRYGKWE